MKIFTISTEKTETVVYEDGVEIAKVQKAVSAKAILAAVKGGKVAE